MNKRSSNSSSSSSDDSEKIAEKEVNSEPERTVLANKTKPNNTTQAQAYTKPAERKQNSICFCPSAAPKQTSDYACACAAPAPQKTVVCACAAPKRTQMACCMQATQNPGPSCSCNAGGGAAAGGISKQQQMTEYIFLPKRNGLQKIICCCTPQGIRCYDTDCCCTSNPQPKPAQPSCGCAGQQQQQQQQQPTCYCAGGQQQQSANMDCCCGGQYQSNMATSFAAQQQQQYGNGFFDMPQTSFGAGCSCAGQQQQQQQNMAYSYGQQQQNMPYSYGQQQQQQQNMAYSYGQPQNFYGGQQSHQNANRACNCDCNRTNGYNIQGGDTNQDCCGIMPQIESDCCDSQYSPPPDPCCCEIDNNSWPYCDVCEKTNAAAQEPQNFTYCIPVACPPSYNNNSMQTCPHPCQAPKERCQFAKIQGIRVWVQN